MYESIESDRNLSLSLFHAVQQSNNENVVRALIDAGADVNKTDLDGRTALFHAVKQSNNEHVVRALIDAGADVNKTNVYGQTALFHSVKQSNNEHVARALIDAGVDVNKTDEGGQTALFDAVQQINNENVIRALIDGGADVNKTNLCGQTALFHAVRRGNKENVVRALIEAGADVTNCGTDFIDETVLFYAVKQINNENVVRALIDAGADVNENYVYGQTALFHAVQQINNENVVWALIDAGADVNKTDEEGQTALLRAVKQSNNENVVRALIDAGADVNKTNVFGQTALFHAVKQSNNENVVRALIDASADVNKTDVYGQTALLRAVKQYNNENVVRALIDAGADVNKTDVNGQTALFDAVKQSNNEKVVRVLIETGHAILNIRDYFGRTALFHAWEYQTTYLLSKQTIQYPMRLKDNCNVTILTFFIENCVTYSCKRNVSNMDVMTEHFDDFIKRGFKPEELVKTMLNLMFIKMPFACVSDSRAVNTLKEVQTFCTLYEKNLLTDNGDASRKMNKIKMMLDNDLKNKNVLSILDLLVDLGADPNSADCDGNTALHYATCLMSFDLPHDLVMDMCCKLEEYGTTLDLKNHDGKTALMLCLSFDMRIYESHDILSATKTLVEVCTFLVKRGSRLEETSRSGECVFHFLMKRFQEVLRLPDKAMRQDMLHEVLKLLQIFTPDKEAKGNIVNKYDIHLNSPLHLWASLALTSPQDYTNNITSDHTFETFLKTILQNLLKCKAKLNARNEKEETPLHMCRTWSAVKLLLDAGANPKDLDSSGRSTLLVAAKNTIFWQNSNHFYPDFTENYQTFWKTAIEMGLDPWIVDHHGDSVLSCLVQSEAYLLAKALVDVACENYTTQDDTIFNSLLNALCKDVSLKTHWKALLVKNLLKSSKSAPITALHFCCRNLIALGLSSVEVFQRDNIEIPGTTDSDGDCDEEPLSKKPRMDESISEDESKQGLQNNSAMCNSVHYEIAKLLRWSRADPHLVDSSGESCLDIAQACPELKHLLSNPIDINTILVFIPWTSVSKKYEDKLSKVARRQEYEVVDSFWYHKENIGSGAFGHVFAGINEKDGREVAIKRVETLRMIRPEDKREITNLTRLADCEQVVRYLCFIEKGDFSYVVLELLEGNLDDYFEESFLIKNLGNPTELCKDVVMGVRFLHQQNILHRDLKPTNILYKCHPKLCLKIADFGLSQCVDNIGKTTVYSTNAGTRCWVAPEVLNSTAHSKSSDIFSCGLLLHYILSVQRHPFSPWPAYCAKKTESVIAFETEVNLRGDKMEGWNNFLSPESSDLVKKMLAGETNIIDRPTANEALNHPLFCSKKEKIDFLVVVGNQPEFECPRAKRTHPLTQVETDLEKKFSAIVRYGTWNDPGYVNMPAIYTEMTPPRRRSYVTSSVVELVRFIRNAYSHVSGDTLTVSFQKMLLEDFVLLEYFPNLVVEVYKAVMAHGWDQTKKEVKYLMETMKK